MSQKVWVIVLVLAVIAAAVFGVLEYRKRGSAPKSDIAYVELEKLPERFPADFPIEEGTKKTEFSNPPANLKARKLWRKIIKFIKNI